jgi:LPS export ABC transporter protein LptC
MPKEKVKSNKELISCSLLTVLCSLLFALSSLLLPGCEGKVKPSVTSFGFKQDIPAQESWDATITFTDSGKVSGILHAGHITVLYEKKITELNSDIKVDFYDENQHHTSVLTAKRGIVNDITHDFEAHENVIVVSDSGTTLKTQELYWANSTRKIHTPAYVEITSPKEQLQGQGLESDQNLVHYTIYKPTGKAKTNESK